MIIRTSMGERAAAAKPTAVPKLSQRELRRLEHTKHHVKKMPEVKEEEIKEEIPVVEEVQEEDAAAVETVEETSKPIVEPGTAYIRSKALEEIETYKKGSEVKPKKKYKVISIGK